jgi:hypothetical protein
MAIAAPTAALLFAVFSFWWLYARRGKLEATVPHSYAVANASNGFRLRFPIGVYNTGARALIVRDLRCWFPDTKQSQSLPWISFRRTIRPREDDFEDFAKPYPVKGRDAVTFVVEFGADWAGFDFVPGNYQVRIEVLYGDKENWQCLLDFPLYVWVNNNEDLKRYIAHSNLPPDDTTLDRVKTALVTMVRELSEEGND